MAEDGWFQVSPFGEFRNRVGERDIVMVMDREGLEAQASALKARAAAEGEKFGGLLVNQDHLCVAAETRAESPTTAMGWIMELEVREDGLWAKAKWSAEGERLIGGGVYKFVSGEWDMESAEDLGEDRVRLRELTGCALTNQPLLPGLAPLCCRKDASGHEHGSDGKFTGGGSTHTEAQRDRGTEGEKGKESSRGGAETRRNHQTTQPPNHQTKKKDFKPDEKGERVNPDDEAGAQRRDPEGEELPKDWDPFGLRNKKAEGRDDFKNEEPAKPAERNANMDKLKELLGLSAEASEEQVAEAVGQLLEAKKALEAEKADAAAEEFVKANAGKIGNAEAVKAAFKRDPEGTKTLLAALKVPEEKPLPVTARIPAQTPATASGFAAPNGKSYASRTAYYETLKGTARRKFREEHYAELVAEARAAAAK